MIIPSLIEDFNSGTLGNVHTQDRLFAETIDNHKSMLFAQRWHNIFNAYSASFGRSAFSILDVRLQRSTKMIIVMIKVQNNNKSLIWTTMAAKSEKRWEFEKIKIQVRRRFIQLTGNRGKRYLANTLRFFPGGYSLKKTIQLV